MQYAAIARGDVSIKSTGAWWDLLWGGVSNCWARALQVINAAGPFSDEVRGLSDAGAPKMIMASSGVHVTLPDYYSPDHLGMIVPKTKARAAAHHT